jgi:hypothetical protein
METLKDIAVVLVAIVLLVLLVLGVYIGIHGIGSGKYRVTVPDGRYTTSYNTDKIIKDGDCIKFVVSGDTMRACGTYHVR